MSKRELTAVEKSGYSECADCGGSIETDYEWLGEINGVGQTDHHMRCENCGRYKIERHTGG
jgi:uncharacterized Zn finger protein